MLHFSFENCRTIGALTEAGEAPLARCDRRHKTSLSIKSVAGLDRAGFLASARQPAPHAQNVDQEKHDVLDDKRGFAFKHAVSNPGNGSHSKDGEAAHGNPRVQIAATIVAAIIVMAAAAALRISGSIFSC
jgi:hypothetical protein